MDNTQTEIVYLPLSALALFKGQPRTHTDAEIARRWQSIKALGFANPICVWANPADSGYEAGTIIAGNGRYLSILHGLNTDGLEAVAAVKHLYAEGAEIYVPCYYEEAGSVEAARALNLSLNAHVGEDKPEIVRDWLLSVSAADFAPLEVTGYTPADLEALNVELAPPAETVTSDGDDVIPDIPGTRAAEGDIYQLGTHRLLCGDATKPEAVALLMNGETADMVFTDPPYGVKYEGGKKRWVPIENDDLNPEDLIRFLTEAFTNIAANATQGAAWYIWYPDRCTLEFFTALTAIGCQPSAVIIWNKNVMAGGWGDYRWKHEPCIYIKGNFYGGRGENTVWDYARDMDYKHPTQKPVHLTERAAYNSSKPGDIILDTFAGSGSTLIGAEATGRVCYAMELVPAYCDIIIKRWEARSGLKAVKL